MEEKLEDPQSSKLLKTVEAVMSFIEKSRSENPNVPGVINNLNHVHLLLNQSIKDNKVNIAKLHEAVHFLERIGVEENKYRFWEGHEHQLAEIMVKNKEIILPESERQQPALTDFAHNSSYRLPRNKRYFNIFGSIHGTLQDMLRDYMPFQKTRIVPNKITKVPSTWEFVYSPNEEGEVMNQSIGRWQASRMTLKTTPDRASFDYQRTISIRGMVAQNEEDIENLLQYLVEGSKYKEQEKETVKKWLRHNGDQDNLRFIDLLIGSGEFTAQKSAAILKTTHGGLNWTLEDGAIVMNIDLNVFALIIEGTNYINNNKMEMIEQSDVEQISSEGPPLLRFQAKITLSVNEEHVVEPRVSLIKVTSYTPNLQPPSLHQEPTESRRLHT